MKLSIVIVAKNEAEFLEACLVSAADLSDDIVLIDDESTDETVSIAKRYKAHVFHRRLDGFATQKNFGIDKAHHQWVLILDADERVSPELAASLKQLTPKNAVAYKIAFRNYLGDKWMRHGGLYPDYHVRLFRKDKARYGQRQIHEELELNGPTGVLEGDIIHLTYKNTSEYLEKVRKYSALEVQSGRRLGVTAAPKEFIHRYIRLAGWRDGLSGLVSAGFLAYYQWLIYRGHRA